MITSTIHKVIIFTFLAMGRPVYAGRADGDYFEDYRVPAGFVYDEATITLEKARELARGHGVLTLANVTDLPADVADALVIPYEDTFLTLPSVTKLDVEAAKALAKRPGNLRLWGLQSLTPGVASALVAHKGQRLELNGVKTISPEVARALANGKRSGGIVLGLRDLPPDIASILAECPYYLSNPKLEHLSLESAKALQQHHGRLGLGKAKIVPEVAEVLLLHDGPLSLQRVKRLEPGVGDILARHNYEVLLMLEEIDSAALARKIFNQSNSPSSVYRLRTMSPEIAAEYARRHPGYLASLDTLSLEAALELAKSTRDINLPAVMRLSPEIAKALTDREPAVYLRGIKSLEGPDAVAVAEALATTPAPVYMEFLERVSGPALAALRTKATITIPPDAKLLIVE